MVEAGDDLKSLAQKAYGNSCLWYVLAAANALSGDSGLIAGTQLKVPEVGVSKNDSGTFKPYNPNEIVGSTSPSLPFIPPASSNQCAMIAMVVVAIVVTALTYGQAAPYLSSMLTPIATLGTISGITTVGAITGGLVAGVAGSIASQVVGKATGAVDHFSLRSAIGNGLATAITMGVGAATAGLGTLGDMIRTSQWGHAATIAVVNASSGYVGNRIAGVSSTGFSWKAIASSAVTSVVTASISNKLNFNAQKPLSGSGQFGQDFINDSIGGVVSLHTRRAFGFNDDVNYGSMLANAFGVATGNGLVRAMQGGSFMGNSSSNSGAKERADWGLSQSQQDQLHQLPDAQQQIFFDLAAQGKDAHEALAAAVTGIASSSDTSSLGGSGQMTAHGQSSGGYSQQQVAAIIYDSHVARFGALVSGKIASPDPSWDLAQTNQWVDEFHALHNGLDAHRDGMIQAQVSDTPILAHMQQSVNDYRASNRRNIDNATSRPEAAIAALAYGINEVSTVPMEAGIGVLGLLSSSARRYQAIDGLDRFLSSKPRDIASSVWNMPREEKLRQAGAMLVGAAAPAKLLTGISKADRIGGVVANEAIGTIAGGPYHRYISSVNGTVLSEADMMSPGSLPMKRAETFSGGRYAEIELNEPRVVYRAWSPGTWAAEDGAYWTIEKPMGSLQTRIDSGLLPAWGVGRDGFNAGIRSQATNWTAIELPAGTRIFLGEVGTQNGAWVGGSSQLLIKGGPNLQWKVSGGELK